MAQPYAETLWTFYQLQEQDWHDTIRQRSQDLYLGKLVAIAFHEPEKLDDEHRKLLDDAGLLGTRDDAMRKTADVITAMQRVDAGTLPTEPVG